MKKGTCLQTYIPMRAEPRSGAEMVSSLLFGESYTVIQEQEDWYEIVTDFDQYKGWISANSYNEPESFTQVVDIVYSEAFAKGEKFMIPCGGMMPDAGKFTIRGQQYELKANLKPNHHLPLSLRLVNTAKSFLNTPYLWGGRCFMGIDCSGLMQVVFKANGINLPRDTKQQIIFGNDIQFSQLEPGDLVFFSRPGLNKVSHVGMMINKSEIIHSSGRVRIDKLSADGLHIDKVHVYESIAYKRPY
ncbi:MAG: NlpC/P60 family protein [Bacteroidota bacterium]